VSFPDRRAGGSPEGGLPRGSASRPTRPPLMGLGRYDRLGRYADGRAYIARRVTRATLTTCGFCFRSYEQAEIVVGAYGPSARICSSCALEATAVFEAN
jgi:hypothetical protein